MATKAGRNDPCPCGSGKKFKKCCAEKTAANRTSTILMVVLGAALIGAIAVGFVTFKSEPQMGGKVWDPAHGHYH